MKVVRITDTGILIKARFDYFDNDPSVTGAAGPMLAENLKGYLQRHIAADDFVAMGVMEGRELASVAFMSVTEMPPSVSVPNGKSGTVFNVLTYPEYRGRGYARAVMEALVVEARSRGLSVMDLHATKAGMPLYEKLGFGHVPYKAMRLKL